MLFQNYLILICSPPVTVSVFVYEISIRASPADLHDKFGRIRGVISPDPKKTGDLLIILKHLLSSFSIICGTSQEFIGVAIIEFPGICQQVFNIMEYFFSLNKCGKPWRIAGICISPLTS